MHRVPELIGLAIDAIMEEHNKKYRHVGDVIADARRKDKLGSVYDGAVEYLERKGTACRTAF